MWTNLYICQNLHANHSIRLSVGFAHGVMNTDNMSVASVTIDYGPFGFVDDYNPNFIPNTSDDTGRYDLESQASVPFILYQSNAQFHMRSSVTVTPLRQWEL